MLSSNSVEISWEPSREDKDAPIDYYTVERKTAEHSRWRQCGKVRSGQHPLRVLVDDLFSDEIYVFRVRAVNSVGEGVSSIYKMYFVFNDWLLKKNTDLFEF